MPNTVSGTVSGKTGPGISTGTVTYPNITALDFLVSSGVLQVNYGAGQRAYIDYNQLTTITMTISGTNLAITIS